MAIRYYIEFITVPLAALVLLWFSPPTGNAAVSSLIAGYFLWVLVEYWMHRWLFHKVFRKAHAIHHARPFDLDGAPPFLVPFLFLGLATGVFWWLLGDLVGPALSAGFLIGYCTYIITHHLIHNGTLGPDSPIRKRHDMHHRGWVAFNFNLLNPLGDLVFGTYREAVVSLSCRQCWSKSICQEQGQCREENIAKAVATGRPCQPDPVRGCKRCGSRGPCSGGPRR